MKRKTKTNKETFTIKGDELIKKIKELVAESNVRRITIKNKKDQTIMVIPLTLGVVGAAIAPIFAAVGAVAALVAECTISVERTEAKK
jgi:hypothetical protein